MPLPLRPADDTRRLDALRQYRVLDASRVQALDDLTALAANICQAPIALITLVDERRHWFKSTFGLSAAEIPRKSALCAHTVLERDLFIVPDAARDERFAGSPMVTGDPHTRFYAGAPLFSFDGLAIGTLCVIDRVPRHPSPAQQDALRLLSQQVMAQLDVRRLSGALADSEARLFEAFGSCPVAVTIHRWRDGTFIDANAAFCTLTGWSRDEVVGRTTQELQILDESVSRPLRAQLATTRALSDLELKIRTRAGDIRHVLIGTAMVEVRDEQHAVTTFVDITARRNAEEALAHAEAARRAVWESSLDAIITMDGEGVIVDANPAAEKTFGYRLTELVGQPLADKLIPPNMRDAHRRGLARLRATGRGAILGRRIELAALRADGSEFPVELTVMSVASHTRPLFIGTIRDITKRRLAEQRIQHLNRVYAVLSDVNQTIVRERDPQAMLDQACRIAVERGRFGMAWIGLANASSGRLQMAAHAGAAVDTLEIVRSMLAGEQEGLECASTVRAWESGGHAVCNDIATDPEAAPWRDIALQRSFRSMASLPLKAGDHVLGTFNLYAWEAGFFTADEMRLLDELAMDIGFALEVSRRETDRRAAEDAVRASDERFRELADNIQEVFWIVDPATRQILYISPAYEKIWGRPSASLYDSPAAWTEALHPDDRERVSAAAESIYQRGSYEETYRIQRPDGTIRWIHDRAFPVRSATGDILRVVGTAEDITEWRQLEEQLRQSQKLEAIGQLAGGIAHDFNNILTVIQGYGSLLMTSEQIPDDVADAAQQIMQATERAASLTRQLLAFSRRQVMHSRRLDLNEVVTSLARMLHRILGEDIRLQLNLGPQPLMTRADAGMLDQVLMNLVINARDAMPDGGELVIETAEGQLTEEEARAIPQAVPGRQVCLRVTDSGSGISPEGLSHIFEPFFTTKAPGKGTGLGLATVFGIVTQHHGSVRVESEVGRGTTFEILLPAAEERVEAKAQKDAPSTSQGGSETILVVEDESSVRRLSRVILERHGYRVLEAADGVEALRVFAEHEGAVQLLLTDIVMPGGMTGRELATHLLARKPALRVIFTSGYSAEIAGRELPLAEGQEFLQKPSTANQLLAAVRNCLDA